MSIRLTDDKKDSDGHLHIVFKTALEVANADEMPHWKTGNEFEGAWKELHGQ